MTGVKRLVFVVMLGLTGAAMGEITPLTFKSTSDPSAWMVATNVGGADGQLASFPTGGFVPAVAVTNKTPWLANVASGTNGSIGTWTFFVFRQTFDLTAYDPGTVDLKFQWGADDSGEGFADRGTWNPKYSLNGGALVANTAGFYQLGPTVDIASGFALGVNTLDFYVEGNGTTDGFVLQTVSVTGAVPEPASCVGLLGALGVLGLRRRGRR